MTLADIVRSAAWDARLEPCTGEDVARMETSARVVEDHLAAGRPIYGLTQGFGPLVRYDAESELEQGSSLIAHLGTGQGEPLSPEASRLILWLRLENMRKGYSAVSPKFWQVLADLWNDGFTPVIPRHGTVSASGDLQPLAHAALAFTGAGDVLAREAAGCQDNPITFDGEVLHGGNFHAMPVGLASDQIGLAMHTVAYLAERQLGLLLSPTTNGDLPPMLTPRAGRGAGLAGVQISATSFVARIRQLVYPASLTTLPTNGWNQDHVPMARGGANSVAEALELGWLTMGSLALGSAQLAALTGHRGEGVWAELARISPPLEADRPMAAEVRAARDLLAEFAGAA